MGFFEKELGCELLQRSMRVVKLTAFEKIVYGRFSTILSEYETLVKNAKKDLLESMENCKLLC